MLPTGVIDKVTRAFQLDDDAIIIQRPGQSAFALPFCSQGFWSGTEAIREPIVYFGRFIKSHRQLYSRASVAMAEKAVGQAGQMPRYLTL
jgi:hypothetical protein